MVDTTIACGTSSGQENAPEITFRVDGCHTLTWQVFNNSDLGRELSSSQGGLGLHHPAHLLMLPHHVPLDDVHRTVEAALPP